MKALKNKKNSKKGINMFGDYSNSPACMPQESFIKMMPRENSGYNVSINDTVKAIDRQIKKDKKNFKKGAFSDKY